MAAVLADIESAAISQQLRTTLRLLGKLTLDHAAVQRDDLEAVKTAGVSRQALEDALDVAYLFNIITRIADALGFYCGPDEAFELSATRLLKRGYK